MLSSRGVSQGWIKDALVDKVTTVKAVYEQKEPYTDEEVTAILDHAAKLDGGTHGYAKQPGTFRLLLGYDGQYLQRLPPVVSARQLESWSRWRTCTGPKKTG